MNNNSKILVTYVTNAGSTAEVAEKIGGELSTRFSHVDCCAVEEVKDLSSYDGVVIGGPMIMGWHRKATRFVRKNRATLRSVPYHVFMTAMEVRGTTENSSISIDSKVAEESSGSAKPTMKERHTHPDYYAAPLLEKKGIPAPRSIALLGGKLDYTKLRFPQVVFVMIIIGAKPGDKRNWDHITSWAESLDFSSQGEDE